jgi:hypothetical protein
MTDRKNIKVDPETFERLREKKGRYETWDGFFNRMVDLLEIPEEPQE